MKNFSTEDLDLIESGKLTYYTWKIVQLERFTFYLKNYRERYNICVNLNKNADVLACVQGIINKISTLREGVFKDLTADINQDISENRNLAVANEQSIISQAKILFPETFANTSCTIEDVLNSNITKLAQNYPFGLQNVHLHNLLNSINYRKKLKENYDKLNGLKSLVSSIYMSVTNNGYIRDSHFCADENVFYCSRDYIRNLCNKIQHLVKQKHKEAEKETSNVQKAINKNQLNDHLLYKRQQALDANSDFQNLSILSLYFSERLNKKRIKESKNDIIEIEETSSPSIYAVSPDEAKYYLGADFDMCFDKPHLKEFLKFAKLQPETIEDAIYFASITNLDLIYTNNEFSRVQTLLPALNQYLNDLAYELNILKSFQNPGETNSEFESELDKIYTKLKVLANIRFETPFGTLRLKKDKLVDENNNPYTIEQIASYTPPLVYIDTSEYDDIPDDEQSNK